MPQAKPPIKANLDSLIEDRYGHYVLLFGKYKGHVIEEVPTGYLRWCLETLEDLPDEFIQIVRNFVEEKKHEGVGSFDFGDW